MSEQPPQPQVAFNVNLPAEQVEGHYADFATVWHNDETFILDFAAMSQPPQAAQDQQGQPTTVISAQIVTRVRIPASQVWEVMKALENQLGQYEKAHPERRPPEPGQMP